MRLERSDHNCGKYWEADKGDEVIELEKLDKETFKDYKTMIMEEVLLNGKLAVRITAVEKRVTEKAYLLDCEGDEVWVPKSLCRVEEGTVLIYEWFYNQLVDEVSYETGEFV